MTTSDDYRRSRHIFSALHFGAALTERNAEDDHVHLLVECPPKVPVSALVSSLKGVLVRRLRQR
jgi:putative transposase